MVDSSNTYLEPKSVVVIPTLNRPEQLRMLVDSFMGQTLKPSKVIVVDASDIVSSLNHYPFPTMVIRSEIRSAAQQRNTGICEILASEDFFDLCFFLDDDVVLPKNYFEKLAQSILKYDAIGVSGVAIGNDESFIKNLRVTRIFGLSGPPGTLTRAAINVPVRGTKNPIEVDWLIGCSCWRINSLSDLRFQKDFLGQSIFEDVIFSVEASKLGKLMVIPEVSLKHLLDKAERPNSRALFRDWVHNRYRLRVIAPEKFDLFQFCMVNLLVGMKRLLTMGDWRSCIGIAEGFLMIVRRS